MGLGKRAGIEGIDQGRGSGLSSLCGKKGGKRYVNLQQILAKRRRAVRPNGARGYPGIRPG